MAEETEETEVTEITDVSETGDEVRDILEKAIEAEAPVTDELSKEFNGEEEAEVAAEPVYEAKFNGYDDGQKAILSSLPPDVQKIIDDRAEKFHHGIEKYRSDSEFARTIKQTLSQERELLEKNNMSPDQYIQNLVNVERQLRSDNLLSRVQAIHAIAASYGVDVNALSQVQFDERTYRIEQENIKLRQSQESQRYSQEESEQENLAGLVEDFRSKNEHFDALVDDIFEILNSGLAKGNTPQERLQSAYDKAARLNDAVFEKNRQASKVNQSKDIVQKAKQSAVQVKGAPAAGSTRAVNSATVYDAVASAFDALGVN